MIWAAIFQSALNGRFIIPVFSQGPNRLRTTQKVIETTMLEIILRNHIKNDDVLFRIRSEVQDVMTVVAASKWNRAGHIAKRDSERWANRVVLWRPLPKNKKSRETTPQKRWTEDINEKYGEKNLQTARDRKTRRDFRRDVCPSVDSKELLKILK